MDDELKENEVEFGLDEEGFPYFEAGSDEALLGFLGMLLKSDDIEMPDLNRNDYRHAEKEIEKGRKGAENESH